VRIHKSCLHYATDLRNRKAQRGQGLSFVA
jgi:hypothetical protein